MANVLIVEARFYPEISDELLKGARRALDGALVHHRTLTVPGALEIPVAIRISIGAADGFIALGCVIRGETGHYDIVAGESARGLMQLGIEHSLAIGNGILTCDTWEQAMARAKTDDLDKGGGAASACLALLRIKADAMAGRR
jgi:6,7-dimethyl-8-ribityllumazine synthase